MKTYNKITAEKIKEILKRSSDSHNVFTPFELCDEMLNKIPELNINQSILVMFNLEFIHIIREKLGKEGLNNIWFLTPDEFKKKAAIIMGVNENHIVIYEYNTKIISSNMPKFDVVVGNPPFQPPVKSDGAGTGSRNKIWHKFVELGFNILKDDGWFAFITPFNWRMSNLKKGVEKYAQELMWNNNIIDIQPANKFFSVGGNVSIDYWIITKNKNIKGMNIPEEFKKIMFYPINEQQKIQDFLNDLPDIAPTSIRESILHDDIYEINIDANDKRKFNFIKSKSGNNICKYPHLNTLEQYKDNTFEWFDKKTKGFNTKKVIISNSVNINTPGSFFAVFDDGKIGCGSHSVAYEVSSDEEGKKLENFINNSNIIKKVFKESTHPTGFGLNLYLIKRIPKSWVERFNNGEDL